MRDEGRNSEGGMMGKYSEGSRVACRDEGEYSENEGSRDKGEYSAT